MSYTFGVGTVSGGASTWAIQNLTITNSAEEATARDNNGETLDATFYNKVEEGTCEAIVPDGATPPVIGSTFAIGSTNYFVTNTQEIKSNTEYRKFQLAVKRYITHALPGSGSGSGD